MTCVSTAAQYVEHAICRISDALLTTVTFGLEEVLHALTEMWKECHLPDWDGYGALPVSQVTLQNMQAFLKALPLGFPPPSLGADPNGHLTADWCRGPKSILSISIDGNGLLHYAALLGSSTACGTRTFEKEIPEKIIMLIQRV